MYVLMAHSFFIEPGDCCLLSQWKPGIANTCAPYIYVSFVAFAMFTINGDPIILRTRLFVTLIRQSNKRYKPPSHIDAYDKDIFVHKVLIHEAHYGF